MEEGQLKKPEKLGMVLENFKKNKNKTNRNLKKKKKHLKTQAAFTEEFDNLFGVIYRDFFQMINFQEVR